MRLSLSKGLRLEAFLRNADDMSGPSAVSLPCERAGVGGWRALEVQHLMTTLM